MDDITVPTPNPKVEDFMGTTELINSHLTQLDHLKEEMAKTRDMLNAIYENDSTYQEHDRLAKEAARVKGQTKKQIQKQPQVADLESKIKEFRIQIKEYSEALSEYLKLYREQTGSTQFETATGETFEIVYVAKFVKKS